MNIYNDDSKKLKKKKKKLPGSSALEWIVLSENTW